MEKELKELKPPAGIWPRSSGAFLGRIIKTQSVAAQRNILPIFFWRCLHDQSLIDNVYREHKKKIYADPVMAFIYVIPQGSVARQLEKGLVDDSDKQGFRIDLAEAIRLGEVYNVEEDKILKYQFYLPSANDLYQWNNSYYIVHDIKPLRYHRLVDGYVVWEGSSELYSGDSADPIVPVKI